MEGVIVMLDFQPFSTQDWNGYAATEPFADGSDPLTCVGGVCVDGAPTEIVIDGWGLQIFSMMDDQPYSVSVVGAPATRILAMLRPKMRHADVEALPGVEILKL